jgi:hypothetical protein
LLTVFAPDHVPQDNRLQHDDGRDRRTGCGRDDAASTDCRIRPMHPCRVRFGRCRGARRTEQRDRTMASNEAEVRSAPRAGLLPGDRGDRSDSYLPVRSRCLHPGQQQGRRWPSSSSSSVRRMRRSRVTSCLASSTQQMNSLRARGVMSFQASSAVGLAISALRRSPGSLCTTPPGTRGLLTGATVADQGEP